LKAALRSSVFDWNAMEVKREKYGARRQVLQSPTATLDELEGHATTINPGESPHAPHRHPEEELMILKEGTVEALVAGETRRVGPGSVIFQASGDLHGLRNVGETQATYHVFRWKSPGGPQAAPSAMGSSVYEWGEMKARREKYGARRQLFQSKTATLEELESHVTTLDAGQATGAPHRHPEEALVIVKEGTVEVLFDGGWRRVGPGSVIFEASNQLHGIRNAGETRAVYHVVKWKSRRTPKAEAR
jgi:quercetin dioxygenase-like cupin family protein